VGSCQISGKACIDVLNAWESVSSHVKLVGKCLGMCQTGGRARRAVSAV
jgi:hypothetical protein